ncbi:MAG: hypothetical protein MUE86_07915 [Thiobacillaceae bacterium]|nr:hypothetical protein [Thiobacillaceae bacterium]
MACHQEGQSCPEGGAGQAVQRTGQDAEQRPGSQGQHRAWQEQHRCQGINGHEGKRRPTSGCGEPVAQPLFGNQLAVGEGEDQARTQRHGQRRPR